MGNACGCRGSSSSAPSNRVSPQAILSYEAQPLNLPSLWETPAPAWPRILVAGLNGSGKTTLLTYLRDRKFKVGAAPTTKAAGWTKLTHSNMQLKVCDTSGALERREEWKRELASADGLLYVIDSSDAARFPVARAELVSLLHSREGNSLTGSSTGRAGAPHGDDSSAAPSPLPVLIVLSKCDRASGLQSSLSAVARDLLVLAHLPPCVWCLQPASSVSGLGLTQGLEWLLRGLPPKSERGKTRGAVDGVSDKADGHPEGQRDDDDDDDDDDDETFFELSEVPMPFLSMACAEDSFPLHPSDSRKANGAKKW